MFGCNSSPPLIAKAKVHGRSPFCFARGSGIRYKAAAGPAVLSAFVREVAEQRLPLDFVSCHRYGNAQQLAAVGCLDRSAVRWDLGCFNQKVAHDQACFNSTD